LYPQTQIFHVHNSIIAFLTQLLINFEEFHATKVEDSDNHAQGRALPMGQPGQSEQLAPPPPTHKNLQKKIAKLGNIVKATSLLN
jgi:hypothetical protein